MYFPYVNSDSREKCIGSPNPLFYRCIFFITKNNTLFRKTRTKLAASEGYWRLLTSPIVEKNMCIFLVVVVAVDILEDHAEDMSENDDVEDVDVDVDDDVDDDIHDDVDDVCLLYTSPSPRDRTRSRMPSSA